MVNRIKEYWIVLTGNMKREIKMLKEELHLKNASLDMLKAYLDNPEPTNEGIQLLYLEKKKVRPFYDSNWMVVLNTTDGLAKVDLVRRDDQSRECLSKSITACRSVGEVKGLDERDRIYYD
jgi:hypothetical protein